MTTSTLSRLDVGNNILNAAGERSVNSLGGILGNLVLSSIREAALTVSNAATWSELRSIINASSWSSDVATLPTTVYRVKNVFWYTSPNGLPATAYDYQDIVIPFVDNEQYRGILKVPFDDNANTPQCWTIESKNVIRVTPYPNNSLARSKVKFEVYQLVSVPSNDTSYFTVSDLLVNLVQYKATELFVIKHTNDLNLAQVYASLYDSFKKQNLISDSGLPVTGYSMYRSKRRRVL
jgi:hypothetical protein